MSKKESTFVNMVAALFFVTLLSSAGVGSVYQATKEPIERARLMKKTEAIREVVPEFDNSPLDEQYSIETSDGVLTVYPAKQNGVLAAVAVETFSSQGFGGEIRLMVGFLPDGTIHDVAVLSHQETPGLGDKMERKKSDFIGQFQGAALPGFKLAVKKDGGDVDAITAATISSRAFCDAVKRAYQGYEQGVSGNIR